MPGEGGVGRDAQGGRGGLTFERRSRSDNQPRRGERRQSVEAPGRCGGSRFEKRSRDNNWPPGGGGGADRVARGTWRLTFERGSPRRQSAMAGGLDIFLHVPNSNCPCQLRCHRCSTIPAPLQLGSLRGIDDDKVERERRIDSGTTWRGSAANNNDNQDDNDRDVRRRRSFLSALTLTTSSMGVVWWDGLDGRGAPGSRSRGAQKGTDALPCVLLLCRTHIIY